MDNNNSISHRLISAFLSLCLVFTGYPFQAAWAEGGGSIVIEYFDATPGSPNFGNPISKAALQPGMRVQLRANAYDSSGASVSCKPNFRAIQGVTGNQLGNIDADGVMEVGNGFGSAEVAASCPELPGVETKDFVANKGLPMMTPAQRAAEQAAAEQAAAESAAGMSGAQAALLGAGLGLGVVGLVVAATSIPSTPSGSSSSSSCPTRSQCCGSSVGSGGCGIVSSCSCPSGTTNMGICTSGGCLSMVSSGRRLCNC